MAVAFRSEAHVIGTGTSPTVGEPAGAASGDWFVALALCDSGSSLTRPASWNQIYSGTQGAVQWDVSWIKRGGSAPSLTWTHSGTKYREVFVIAISGSTATALDSQSSSGATGNATLDSHTIDPPATTAVDAACLAITGGLHYAGSSGGWTAPTGYTLRSNNAAGNDGAMATKALSGAGSDNPSAFTTGSGAFNADYWDGFTITIAPADAGGGATFNRIVPQLMMVGVGT